MKLTLITLFIFTTGLLASVHSQNMRVNIHANNTKARFAVEGMAYSLVNNPDPALEKKADEWIDKFAAAQQPDGYINTFYTLTGLDKRWTNMDKHEMYCAGHMMEAAVAYYQATGKRKLLDVCIRMADHMMSVFGPGKRDWVPGHEEIELALVKLYKVTNDPRYLDFANWLLEERGHGHGTMGGEGNWNQRMHQLTGDTKYVDVLERSMYNGALAGISLAGDRFFYVKPLESKGDHHRQAWYGCACCPSQISRFLPSIGSYVYGTSENTVWVNLYIGNTAEVSWGGNAVTIRQVTDYPWNGRVSLEVAQTEKPLSASLRLRIPGWCKRYAVDVNGEKLSGISLDKGYITIERTWNSGDTITLDMDMPVEVMAADPRVKEDAGKRALQRGPLVYCMEEVDNTQGFDQAGITPETAFETVFNADVLDGVETIRTKTDKHPITFIPYYAWDNRAAGKMRVWIPYPE